MSPSEFDLRAALHQGEGQPLDPDRVVAAGRAERSRRRTRLASVAAAIVLVAGGAGVTAALVSGDEGRTGPELNAAPRPSTSASSPATRAPAGAQQSDQGRTNPSRGIQAPAAGDVRCPDSFPQRLLPGGGSPGQFGSDGDLFPTTPVSIVVCSYGDPATTTAPGRTVLTEAQAQALVASLESASKQAPSCPPIDGQDDERRAYAFLGVGSDGRALRTVTAEFDGNPCDTRVTNGTAVRFAWQPPASLQPVLDAIPTSAPTGVAPRPQPTGKKHGSPVR
ncbi:hypothetical protein [Jatrophihabitans fulvus]